MVDWPRVQVKDVCSLIVDCVNRTAPVVEYETPYRMIRTTNVRDGRVNLTGCRYVTEDTFRKWTRRAAVLEGDVILTREAPIGEVGFIKNMERVFLGQRTMQYRANPAIIVPRYLFYAFRSAELQNQFRSHDGSGSVVSHIKVAECHKFLVPLAPYKAQLFISEFLGALDDKIELNRQMNETLEATARAIFKDWFVEFGPTRAKMAGAESYLAPGIWKLFPDRLDDEGKPEGWNYERLDTLVEVNPSERLRSGATAPYLDMAALPTSGAIADSAVPRIFTSGMRFRNGDTLFARITPCLENGKTAYIQSLPAGEIGWGSTEFIVLRARPPAPSAITYLLARDTSFRTFAIQSMTGTSGRQRARTEALAGYQLASPPAALWDALGKLIEPMFERIHRNGEESSALAATRDLLLPKLMSGEISVRKAESTAETVLAKAS